MRRRLTGTVLVTLTEGPAVYLWLRLDRAGEPVWGIVCLVVGQLLETAAIGIGLRSALAPPPVGARDGIAQHIRTLQRKFALAVLIELLIWVAWLALAIELGQVLAAGFLLVAMHLKHQLETAAVRDTGFTARLFSPRGTAASAAETAGAVACLALLLDGGQVLAAVALAAGFLIEHALLIDRLYLEMETRDIGRPRLSPPQAPLRLRPLDFLGERFGPLWSLVQRIGPLDRLLNRAAINALVKQVPPRPNPLSTMSPYTSWASLTDRSFSGRHLPPTVSGPREHPAIDAVAGLFRRGDEMTPCPKSTVLFAYFAQWFTDGFLRTQRAGPRTPFRDTRRNESTHDVDLAQLYGLNAAMTDALRLKRGGLLRCQEIQREDYPEYLCRDGEVKPEFGRLIRPLELDTLRPEQRDTLFAMGTDTRNLGFAAFNVLFLREHNRIARRLAATHPRWDDERLFATARIVLIVVLLRIVVEEYINHITPYHFGIRLPSAADFRTEPWLRPNWMAIEFNLLYRWHSLVPSTFALDGQNLTIADTLGGTDALTAAGLGAFMRAASAQRAGRIGLFNSDVLLVENAEKPSIGQGRAAQLRPYNDYRTLCRLPPARHFGGFSTDPRIRDGLRDLYDTVDEVEFYVGLFAEEASPYAVLPPLMAAMVAFDAFSQVLTNPLVAPRVYDPATFSTTGMEIIGETRTLAQLVERNVPPGSADGFVGMTWQGYQGP